MRNETGSSLAQEIHSREKYEGTLCAVSLDSAAHFIQLVTATNKLRQNRTSKVTRSLHNYTVVARCTVKHAAPNTKYVMGNKVL